MKKLLTLYLLSLALVATACGSGDDPTVNAEDQPAAAEQHNDADVEFAQGMIPHHEQAIEMADLVIERGESEEVKALAADIKGAQGPEIETLRGWLEDWGEEESSDAGGHAGMGTGEAETMMSEDEMVQLEQESGAELDKMFLEMMIQHHEGAITMAETEVEQGEFADAKDLAQRIVDTQQAEITTMKDLLTKLGG